MSSSLFAEGERNKEGVSFGPSRTLSGYWYSTCFTLAGSLTIDYVKKNSNSSIIRYEISGSDVFHEEGHYSPISEATLNLYVSSPNEDSSSVTIELEHDAWKYNPFKNRKISTFSGGVEKSENNNWFLSTSDDDVSLTIESKGSTLFATFEYDGPFKIDDVGCFIVSDGDVDPDSFYNQCEMSTKSTLAKFSTCRK